MRMSLDCRGHFLNELAHAEYLSPGPERTNLLSLELLDRTVQCTVQAYLHLNYATDFAGNQSRYRVRWKGIGSV